MKSQFAHIESFSIKKNPKSKKTDVAGVCGEVTRAPGFCDHVDEVQRPDLLFGMDPLALQKKITTRFDELNESSKTAGGRALRKDQLVMTAGFFSYPGTEVDETFLEWSTDCLNFLGNKYGKNLKSVVAHYDEGHPHIHFLLCDLQNLRVDNGLDPAKTAQRDFRQLKKTDTLTQKDALKAFQDDFFNAVGVKYGHARKLGARERLRGSPKAVRAILAEMKLLEEEKLALKKEVDELALQKTELNAKAQFLREKAHAVLLLEKRFVSGLDALDQEFEKLSLIAIEAKKSGDFAKAEQVKKQIFKMRDDVLASPALVAGLNKRTTKPAWA